MPNAAVVRVVNITGRVRSYGSGTLVHTDGQGSTILSCAHLFREGKGRIWVGFADGRQYEATLARLDPAWDLSALSIPAVTVAAVPVASEYPRPGEPVWSCGYGPDGRYRCNQGRALGYASTAGTKTHETLRLSGSARDGDSGGPVLNRRGELVAVIWGTDGRTVAGTYCGRIRRFLAGLLGRPKGGGVPGAGPVMGRVGPGRDRPGSPTGQPAAGGGSEAITVLDRLAELEREAGRREQSLGDRLGRIETAVGSIGALRQRIERAEAATTGEGLRAAVREAAGGALSAAGPTLWQVALPPLLAALGWTGPPALAAIVGLKLLEAIVRRRRSGRSPSRRRRRPRPLNDEYAKQLNALYSLSGRSTPADATLGREFDRELREAEGQGDDALARWARRIRRRVAKRFYRIHGESPMPAEPTGQT